MPWLQIRFPAVREQAQQLGDVLEECGAISVSIEHAGSGDAWVESDWDETPVWQQSRVTGLFPEYTDVDAVRRQMKQMLGTEPPVPTTDLLADEDWASSWMAHYKPLQAGKNLWICPSWIAPPAPEAVNVILDPGLAFGTGDHPTTALCLEWLVEQNLQGKDMMDYGCGSGILSIAALKLGARAALGVDIDEQALEVSRRNAVLNGVSDRFQAFLPDHFAGSEELRRDAQVAEPGMQTGRASALPDGGRVTDGAHRSLPPDARADIVIANILARPLVELAPRIMARVRPGGWLALSGMLREQVETMHPPYARQFAFEVRRRGEWVLLAGRKTA